MLAKILRGLDLLKELFEVDLKIEMVLIKVPFFSVGAKLWDCVISEKGRRKTQAMRVPMKGGALVLSLVLWLAFGAVQVCT